MKWMRERKWYLKTMAVGFYRKFFPAVFILPAGSIVFFGCGFRKRLLCKIPDKSSKGAGEVAVDGGI